MSAQSRNVLDKPLEVCSLSPLTGFRRDGDCRMESTDFGRHGVCAQVTAEFLAFTKRRGNDLSTPQPHHGFPGLKPGDRWCLCVDRWKEAQVGGVAPPVVLSATHRSVLKSISLTDLKQYALPKDG
jgi:uncharacterized protein (DUF2237 family)